MIRLYDTTKGVIATDLENRSLRKPGHILIAWSYHNGETRGGYTKHPVPLDNLVEEIPEGSTIKYDLQRLMDKCPILKRMILITEKEYQTAWEKCEKPGCIGQFLQKIGIAKTLDDELRKYFKS